MLVPAAVTCWLYKQGGGRQVAVLSMAPRTTLLVPLLCLGAAALAAAAPMLFTEEEALDFHEVGTILYIFKPFLSKKSRIDYM